MKLFTAAQIRQIDALTISRESIPSHQLMERAASACTDWIKTSIRLDTPIVIIGGAGNNGGDGFAIARQLLQHGYQVLALFLRHAAPSADCLYNLNQLIAHYPTALQMLEPGQALPSLPSDALLVDALFGTGLSRPVTGWLATIIRQMNDSRRSIVSIDLPSGLQADAIPAKDDAVVQAQHTLSFQFYKRTMLHPEGGRFCGKVHVLDIGLNEAAMLETPSHYSILNASLARKIYRPRDPFAHKGTAGTAVIIGGSYGMMGAAALSARAAGRAGAGKVRMIVPECGYTIVQTLAPEAMAMQAGTDHLEHWGEVSAEGIGIGPGMGTHPDTSAALHQFLKQATKPLVLDADALNILAAHPEWLALVPTHTILTPHPGEFQRLFGQTDNSLQRTERARAMAMRYNIHIVLKDRYSFIALADGRCYYNTAGNAGLATGGSGDVLTGIITGLLASGYSPEYAAQLGVWLHGRAGDYALAVQSVESMVATDLPEYMGKAFKELGD